MTDRPIITTYDRLGAVLALEGFADVDLTAAATMLRDAESRWRRGRKGHPSIARVLNQAGTAFALEVKRRAGGGGAPAGEGPTFGVDLVGVPVDQLHDIVDFLGKVGELVVAGEAGILEAVNPLQVSRLLHMAAGVFKTSLDLQYQACPVQ
jgi:hypothetical protein